MPDGDVFSPLGRGYALAGRQLAHGLDPAIVALTVIRKLCNTLNQSRHALTPLFDDLRAVLDAARREQQQSPLLASDPLVAYEHWKKARAICREHRKGQVPLVEVAEAAIVQALVDERQPSATQRKPVSQTFALAFATQLFEQHFAGRVEGMLQSHGLPADDAHRRTEQCRAAVLASPHFEGVVIRLAKNPGARHRLVGIPTRKQTTAQILNQSLGNLLSPTASAKL